MYFVFYHITFVAILSLFSQENKVVFFMHVEKYSLIRIGATVNSDKVTAFTTVELTAFALIFCHFCNYINQDQKLK